MDVQISSEASVPGSTAGTLQDRQPSNEDSSPNDEWPELAVREDEDFEKALLHYGCRKRFMLGLFLLCASPGILNGLHMMVYVFYGHTPKHWCSIPALENADWTPEQIRNVSSPQPKEWSNCEYYKRDYEKLRGVGYDEALRTIKSEKKPHLVVCDSFSYEMEQPGTSIVPEWDLVCDRLALKATVQTAVSFGKFLGAFTFGLIADKYGRKISFVAATCIYIVAGPIVAFTSFYQLMIAARVCLGIAGLGVFESAYSIVSEVCPPKLRPTMGVLHNQSYPLGILSIALVGYYVKDWRKLQLCISLPALLLVFHVWLIPESPRWLYYSGRKGRAWTIVGKFLPSGQERVLRIEHARRESFSERIIDGEAPSNRWTTRFRTTISSGLEFLKNREFRLRLLVCWVIWCFTAMSYYSLTINAENLHMDPYLYVALSGVVEVASYTIVVPLIGVTGRRTAITGLLTMAAGAILVLLIVPTNMKWCELAAALLGRLCISGVFCVVIVYTFELFPTTTRNTAMGTSSTMAHCGSIFAPYLVDFFVIYGWYVPSTICGLTLLAASMLTQMLPETKGLPLYNTLQDLSTRCRSNPEERVSFGNCALCYFYRQCKKCCIGIK